ncbi:MAG: hypothetical protein JXR10_17915 [Cyclobacteriaceae bacterium]
MSFTYIQFESPNSEAPKEQPSKFRTWFENFCEKYLPHFIPRANPDFDQLIDGVTHWQVELNNQGIPEREIGLSPDGEPIMIMPWNNNYGYWTDNNLKESDFSNLFEVTNLEYEAFKLNWYSFGSIGCASCFKSKISEFIDERTWLEFDLELTKRLGNGRMQHVKSVHDGIPDMDGEYTIYQCMNCKTKWKLKEPYDRGGGYFRPA